MKKFSISNVKNYKSNLLGFANVFVAVIICFVGGLIFCGCSRGVIGYRLKSLPNKIAYQVGEMPNFDGLRIETINSDGTYSKCYFAENQITNVDTSTPGIKKVTIEKDNMSLSFNIYVANVVVNDSDNLKQILLSANNGDILYLRSGQYTPQTDEDEKFKDIVINKSVTIIGDGSDKTIFSGNFIVGANYDGAVFSKITNFKDINFYGIGFKLDYKIQNGFINYTGPYGKTDKNGAIRCFDTKNLNISNCSFSGYGYGVFGDSVEGMSITNCTFKDIKKTAIITINDISNSTIFKNIFIDIAKNIISFEGEKQSDIGAIKLNFATEGQKGVIICKNVFNRIALHDGDLVYYDENSKTQAETIKSGLYSMSYINNSSVIYLLSSTQNDLQVTGIVLSLNNYGQTLQNLNMGAKGKNTINQNGVIIVD